MRWSYLQSRKRGKESINGLVTMVPYEKHDGLPEESYD